MLHSHHIDTLARLIRSQVIMSIKSNIDRLMCPLIDATTKQVASSLCLTASSSSAFSSLCREYAYWRKLIIPTHTQAGAKSILSA